MKKIFVCLCVGILMGCSGGFVSPTSGTTIVAFGDSLTQGYGLAAGEDYASQLSAKIGKEIINAGVSGDTTSEALQRLQSDVLSRDPRLVIVLLGGNDALQKVNPDTTFANIENIVDQILATGSGVILVGVRGGIHNGEYKRRFKEIAKSRNVPYVEDALKGIFGKRALMYDSVHPNKQGYAIFVERLAPVVEKLLN